MHLTFFKAGWQRWNREEEMLETINHNGRDRLPVADQKELISKGFELGDHILLRDSIQRLCNHWNTLLRYLPIILNSTDEELMEYEPEWVELRKQDASPQAVLAYLKERYPQLSAKIAKFITDGMPTEEIQYPVLYKTQSANYTLQEIKDPLTYLDKNACATCHFYAPSHDSNGSLKPFKGVCNREVFNKGVFAMSNAKAVPTYTFMSCSKYFFSREDQLQFNEVAPLSGRMLPFTEQNPYDRTLTQLLNTASSPKYDIAPVMSDGQFKDLKLRDVFTETNEYRDETDFNLMNRKMGLQPIFIFFAKGLKHSNVNIKRVWDTLGDRYIAAEEMLFGEISTDLKWGTGLDPKNVEPESDKLNEE